MPPPSKLIVLGENKEIVALPKQFHAIWQSRHAMQIEYPPGQAVIGIDSRAQNLKTQEGGRHQGDVINLIPQHLCDRRGQGGGYASNRLRRECPGKALCLKRQQSAPIDFPLLNVCYAFIGSNEAIRIAQVFKNEGSALFKFVPGTGSSSPLDMTLSQREYINAEAWLANMLAEFSE